MATKIDPRSQPRSSADGTGEVTPALLREQFQHSFVPRSEDDAKIPMVSPKIAEARITGRQSSITESRCIVPGFQVTPASMIVPGVEITSQHKITP